MAVKSVNNPTLEKHSKLREQDHIPLSLRYSIKSVKPLQIKTSSLCWTPPKTHFVRYFELFFSVSAVLFCF